MLSFHFLKYIVFLVRGYFQSEFWILEWRIFAPNDTWNSCHFTPLQWLFWVDRYTNAEFTDTAHATFKMSEKIHKSKVTRKIGTPSHKEMALNSLACHNYRRAGYASPSEFVLRRKSSPRVGSRGSPYCRNSRSIMCPLLEW